jgi:glucans biosynthesis protein
MSSPHRTFARLMLAAVMLSPLGAAASGFDFQQVVDKARELAAQPYKAPPVIPRFMRELTYDQYQDIRFDPEQSLWRESDSRFQVMFFSAGLFYTHPVAINVIDAEGVHAVPYRKSWFSFADAELERRVPADLGFAGFRLAFPLTDGNEHNQFLVFAGASYFRGVGRDNAWGISGRGIAIDTGLPSGEEFPSFVEFWLERPSPGAEAVRFYGLLDGESVTGAYRFTAHPGAATRLDVEAVLFARDAIELLGVAPLTSMFFYGENTARPTGEWRSEVHDSDGLLIHDGATDEWLWRPLLNPVALEMDFFRTGNVRGFGLLQRDTQFANYHDLGARYERRPSAWVAPQGDWGAGEVVLVQIPTASETNDNIVAFWTPAQKLSPGGEPLSLAYTVSFGTPEVVDAPMGRAVNTFVGDGNIIGGGNVEGAYRFIVDFAGGPLDTLEPRAAVVGTVSAADGGEVIEHFVEYNEALRTWRLSVLARPQEGKSLDLRAFLREGDTTLTETWTYRLPATNDVRVRRR